MDEPQELSPRRFSADLPLGRVFCYFRKAPPVWLALPCEMRLGLRELQWVLGGHPQGLAAPIRYWAAFATIGGPQEASWPQLFPHSRIIDVFFWGHEAQKSKMLTYKRTFHSHDAPVTRWNGYDDEAMMSDHTPPGWQALGPTVPLCTAT